YQSYREAVSRAVSPGGPLGAEDLNRRLASERLRPGRGLERAADRILWKADIDRLPVGSVIVDPGRPPQLLLADRLLTFGFAGWSRPMPRPSSGTVEVLTPPTSVAALTHGFTPILHPTASS
ncbi:MAG TPA: hypothetical protein VMS99_18360, partial [Acidimicrobiia bacterium]|nr:hypothetical protein [Acidimicrobiia bacterium]